MTNYSNGIISITGRDKEIERIQPYLMKYLKLVELGALYTSFPITVMR